MNTPRPALPDQQRGVMLLEVLIALLIFALGVLGLIGLQATAAKESGQAKYRADATLLANDLIGQMWVTSRNITTLTTAFTSDGSGGPQYLAWLARVNALLPGSAANPPTVVFTAMPPLPAIDKGVLGTTPAAGLPSGVQVTITMFWKAPGEPSSDPAHNIVLVNEIR